MIYIRGSDNEKLDVQEGRRYFFNKITMEKFEKIIENKRREEGGG